MALLKVGKQNINQEDCVFPRKIEKAYFVTELKTIPTYNSQSVSTSISLTPALFIHLYSLASAYWSLYALEFATSQDLRIRAGDSDIRKGPSFRGKE